MGPDRERGQLPGFDVGQGDHAAVTGECEMGPVRGDGRGVPIAVRELHPLDDLARLEVDLGPLGRGCQELDLDPVGSDGSSPTETNPV